MTHDNVEFINIEAQQWDSCMRLLKSVDVLYDQFVLGGYGMVSVEASIFGAAIFCKLDPAASALMEKESGMRQPFIQWLDSDELKVQSHALVDKPELQKAFAVNAANYCQKMHDDPNVAERFLKILEKF
jgi:hypothetical protein